MEWFTHYCTKLLRDTIPLNSPLFTFQGSDKCGEAQYGIGISSDAISGFEWKDEGGEVCRDTRISRADDQDSASYYV